MIFDSDDLSATLLRVVDDQLGVKWLDGERIEHTDLEYIAHKSRNEST